MPKRGNLRWWIIGLVTLGTILNYLARSTLSITAPTLKQEFSMDTEQYSWVILAFQATYTIMQSVAGGILDALGTRLGFFIFAIGWGLANMAHAFATGWPSLALFRGLWVRRRRRQSPRARRPSPNGSRPRSARLRPARFRWGRVSAI
jgi:ACS family hexuronate transporter-like MFS transporter